MVLYKLLSALLFPLGLVCMLCLASGAAALKGRRRTAAGCAFAAFGILYLASTSPLPHFLLRGLEGRYPQLADYPRSPAIVILGGAAVEARAPRLLPETNAFGDRLLYGALLFRRGLAPRIVVTGGKVPLGGDFAVSEAAVYARILREYFGVDSASLILADGSRNTREDAQWVLRRMEEMGMPKEIILVTSAAHMPRSVALFRKQGFIVHPAPTDFHASTEGRVLGGALLPSEANIFDTWYALHEYAGFAAYKVFGWI
jgi:uncharacterized SAM-binding protein YcdF (DUF218 family)